jgi:DtxR family Mn-dependent transcriptional regulator
MVVELRSQNENVNIKENDIEEFLEFIWTIRERGDTLLDHVISAAEQEHPATILKELERRGLISLRDNKVILEEDGERRAGAIVRRHRLAEILLSEVLELEEKHIHPEACKFEHILSPEVTESVCTFLGHPPTCPHGKAIPRGQCCKKFGAEIKPLVFSLKELSTGGKAKIIFITSKYHSRLDRLGALGFIPGSVIRLHQKKPSYVVKLGETDLALDEDICREIYVRKLD